jgi:hypothetical protein
MLLIGEPSINGPFSMAMLNNQMVIQNEYIKRRSLGGIFFDPWPNDNGSKKAMGHTEHSK